MKELEKAYEAVDMLKALDLPISKAQLDDIERLEKENGKVQSRQPSFLQGCATENSVRFYGKCMVGVEETPTKDLTYTF